MIYDLTVPQFIKTLKNLDAMLDKAASFAETKKFDTEVLLQSRLAPDQFPLIRQIQITCDTAKLGASRLTGKAAPTQEDNEKTLADAKARIQSVISYLGDFNAHDYTNAANAVVTQPRWEGKTLTGSDYAIHHVIPNFYFHVTTAYAILRHNGVDIGKKDFLGALPYKLP
ncbi:MAG: DUF1993 domain-containing protein [Bdellovibrionales bacterium]|nr:DUF1993 domain-containing protein [Bdellovibrionales bacterium]